MNPDPLYMLMKNMTQRAHGPRPYDGILGASQEKVVAYEGEGAGTLEAAADEALMWVQNSGTYADGDEGILIEICVVGRFGRENGHAFGEHHEGGLQTKCSCSSSRTCEPCLNS